MKLINIASVIRSKNSGPYELTFDVIFKDFETYGKVKAAQAVSKEKFCALYGIPETDVFHLVYFDPAKAVKITIRRPIPSGALGETDVYGAQQHAPLMGMEIEI
nr:DUF4387 domain-containing protein [uncultured Alloprevotella sp.]